MKRVNLKNEYGTIRKNSITLLLLLIYAAFFYLSNIPKIAIASEEWQQKNITGPSARWGSSMVYDKQKEYIVLFGGCDSSQISSNETWLYDGDRWYQPTISGSIPTARHEANIVYDASRGVVVLYGGYGDYAGNTKFSDTWEWNGINWTQTGDGTPSHRITAGMTYDEGNAETVLYGGYINGGANYNETWTYNGSSWILENPTTNLGHRNFITNGMAYDTVGQQVILFGGNAHSIEFNDTWSWKNGTWTQLTSGYPEPRLQHHAMATNPLNGFIYMFGGSSSIFGYSNNLYAWNGIAWQQKATSNTPLPRVFHNLAFDIKRNKLILYGGQAENAQLLDDTWEYGELNKIQIATPNGGEIWQVGTAHNIVYSVSGIIQSVSLSYSLNNSSSWNLIAGPVTVSNGTNAYSWLIPNASSELCRVRIEDASSTATSDQSDYTFSIQSPIESGNYEWVKINPQSSPSPRLHTALVFDEDRHLSILFGGRTGNVPYQASNETWEYDGLNWILRYPANAPSARWGSMMAYDPIRKKTVLYGGGGNTHVYYSDTWEWDGVDWIQLFPTVSPPSRFNGAMAFDPIRQKIVLFGGYSMGLEGRNDMWEWNGNNWSQINPNNRPQPRMGCTLVRNCNENELLLFGGYDAHNNIEFSDTWTWSGSNWSQVYPDHNPSGRQGYYMAFDSLRKRIVFYGGYKIVGDIYTYEHYDETWEWDNTDWIKIPTTVNPGKRHSGKMVYDVSRKKLVLFAGGNQNQITFLNDTWEYGLSEPVLSLEADNTELYRGQEKEFTVALERPAGTTEDVVGYRVAVVYDPAQLIYLEGSATQEGSSTATGWSALQINSAIPGRLLFTCASINHPLTGSATLLKFTLRVNEALPDGAPLTLQFDPALTNLNDTVLAADVQGWNDSILGPNHPPSFTSGGDVTVLEDSGVYNASWASNISTGAIYETTQNMQFQVTVTRPELFTVQPALNPSGNLTFTPALNLNGSAAVTVVLQDDGGAAHGGLDSSLPHTFTLNLLPVNDAPFFIAGASAVAVLNSDGSPQVFPHWATALSAGPPDEASQSLFFSVLADRAELFAATPAISPGGDLSFTPQANAHGIVNATVFLYDSGGTLNGGFNRSLGPQPLRIKIYIPFLWGDLNGSGGVGAVDASYLLQYNIGLIETVPGYPVAEYPEYYPDPATPWLNFPPAADVTDDGIAGTLDAADILKQYIFLIEHFLADGNGDDYGPDRAVSAKRVQMRTAASERELRFRVRESAGLYVLTLAVDEGSQVRGLRVGLNYDPQALELQIEGMKCLPAGNLLVSNAQTPGRLVLAAALPQELEAGEQDLLEIPFRKVGTAAASLWVSLDLELTQLNDGLLRLSRETRGAVDLLDPTAVSQWMIH